MNRRSFLAKLVAGLAALPLIGNLFKTESDALTVTRSNLAIRVTPPEQLPVIRRAGCEVLFEIPPEAGKVLDLNMSEDGRMFLMMENGVWISDRPYNSCRKFIV